MTVLIDSWAWIEYFRGSAAGRLAQRHIDGDELAVVSAVNIAETYRWLLLHASAPEAEAKRRLIVRRCAVRDLTAYLAVEAAKIRHSKGLGLGDAVVYATSLAEKARLVTGDPDFRGFEGVEFLALKVDRP